MLQAFPSISTTQGRPSILLPLLIVIIISAVKDALEDYGRWKGDWQKNNEQYKTYHSGHFHKAHSKDLLVGDILMIEDGQRVPADCILLVSGVGGGSIVYVDTKNLDGETNLKPKQVPKAMLKGWRRGLEGGRADGYEGDSGGSQWGYEELQWGVGRIEKFLATPEIEEETRGNLDVVGFEMKDAQFTWGKEVKEEKEGKEGDKKEKGAKEEKGGKKAKATATTLDLDRVTVAAASAEGLGGGAPLALTDVGHSSSTYDLGEDGKEEKDSKEEGKAKEEDEAPAIPRLTKVTLSLRPGELLQVLGAVGTGKTTLLYGVLGEVEQTGGSTALGGTVAYVPQVPFIINASLRDNILFGNPLQQQRYDACVDACCLRQDIAILPNGDLTEIGERGINLSGGQKQRVQLARAAYQQSDMVLLDDPLSAVDPHVAEQLFSQCIQGLMGGRARVLVTHSLAFVDAADNIALVTGTEVKDCYTVVQGTAAQLRENNAEFKSLLATYTRGGEDMQGGEEKPKVAVKPVVKGSLITVPDTADKAKGSLMEEEEQETGVVDWKVYRAYIVAGCSRWQYLIIPLTFMAAQAIQTSSDFWLSKWSNNFNASVGPYLGVYGALIFATTSVTIFRSFSVSTFGLRASRILHHNLAHSVLRKCISWYDRTPSGRLTNRFTKVSCPLSTPV